MMEAIYPWQSKQWLQLLALAQQKKLGHAWLLSGASSLGKLTFALNFAQTLLCQQGLEQEQPCGSCQACQWLLANNHPDLHLISAENKTIKIDQIRGLSECLHKTGHAANSYKIAIIEPADALNTAAANALLKTLEEPASNCLLILVTAMPSKLPATIRSRCQQLTFSIGNDAAASAWLRQQIPACEDPEGLMTLAEGRPLLALKLGQDANEQKISTQLIKDLHALAQGNLSPIKLASQYLQTEVDNLLNLIILYAFDIIRTRMSLVKSLLTFKASAQQTLEIAQRLDSCKLFQFIDRLINLRKYIQQNLNQQLMLEDIFCEWYKINHE